MTEMVPKAFSGLSIDCISFCSLNLASKLVFKRHFMSFSASKGIFMKTKRETSFLSLSFHSDLFPQERLKLKCHFWFSLLPCFVLKVSVEGGAQRTQPQGCPGGLGLMPNSTSLACCVL